MIKILIRSRRCQKKREWKCALREEIIAQETVMEEKIAKSRFQIILFFSSDRKLRDIRIFVVFGNFKLKIAIITTPILIFFVK